MKLEKKAVKKYWDEKGRILKKFCKICSKKLSHTNKYGFCNEHWLESNEFQKVLANYKKYKKGFVYNKFSKTYVYLLSGLEFNYFEYLEKNNIEWYKPKPIEYNKDGKIKKYYCDFYLSKTNELIEIKGYWWAGDKLKMKLVKEQNPNLNIKILFSKEVNSLV